MDIDSVIASSALPILVADDAWRVVALNPAAEAMLGLASAEASGKACHELICGMDVHGPRCYYGSSVVGRMANGDEPVQPFETVLRTHDAKRIRARVLILVVPGPRPGARRILHMLLPLHDAGCPPPAFDPAALRLADGNGTARLLVPSPNRLSESELRVLRLLASGKKCQEIADTCCVSLFTARNQVQSILRKLDVHSQIEAVAAAHRKHLL